MPVTTPRHGALAPAKADEALATWHEHDLLRAVHELDRRAVPATEAPRALVLDLLARPGNARDLYNACARLGRELADAGASPSLAATTLDGAALALDEVGTAFEHERLAPARASTAEGYVGARMDAERTAARRTWEYPACAVKVGPGTVAIVAGYPTDDAEALGDWSARVALCVSRDAYKRAILSGPEAATSELGQALATLGVEVAAPAAAKGWLSSLLRR